jgi:aminocarboxymuconate-semialdehyde decarboxylase
VKRVDLHSHVLPEPVLAEMAAKPELYRCRVEVRDGKRWYGRGRNVFEVIPEFHDGLAKCEAMDRMKIDISYISPGPQSFGYWMEEADAARNMRLVNDGIAAMVAQNPERLRGMATLPMQHPDLAIAELERVVKEHGFRAVEIATAVQGDELAKPKYRPVLRALDRMKIAVFTHPENLGATGRLDCYYLTNLIGNPLDTTIMAANLMMSGVFEELKDIRFLLPHAGGFVAADIGRFDHGHRVREETKADCQASPSTFLRRFWFDALAHNPTAVRFLIDQVGADRVVLGTDSPFDMGDLAPVDNLLKVPRLTAHEQERICYRNAEEFLGGRL